MLDSPPAYLMRSELIRQISPIRRWDLSCALQRWQIIVYQKQARSGYWGDVAMRSVLFLVGLVLGFLGGVGTIIYLQQRNKDTGEMSIVFAQKSYYETPAVVTVSGEH
jgi:hypothetical protein